MKLLYLGTLSAAVIATYLMWPSRKVPPARLSPQLSTQSPLPKSKPPLTAIEKRELQSKKVQELVESSRRSTEEMNRYHSSRYSEEGIKKSVEVSMKVYDPWYRGLCDKWNLSDQDSQAVLDAIRRRRHSQSLTRDKYLSGFISGGEHDRSAQETLELYRIEMAAILGEDRTGEVEQIENEAQVVLEKSAKEKLEIIRQMQKK